MENSSKRRKSIFQPTAKAECRDPLLNVQQKRAAEKAETEPAPKVRKEVVNVKGFIFRRVVEAGAASAHDDAAGAAPAAPASVEERQDSQASTGEVTTPGQEEEQADTVPPYPTGERPSNLDELVPPAMPAEERLQTLCEHAVRIETEQLLAAFQGENLLIAEAGVEALKEFQLQVEQACVQGEIRCGSAPVPGLAEKKQRLREMLQTYQDYEQKWNAEMSAEQAKLAAIQMVQGEEEAAAAAAAAAEAVAGSRAGHVAAEVVGSEQRLIKQSFVFESMTSKIATMIGVAEKTCRYFAGELNRQDMGTLPHAHSPHNAIRDVARSL